MGSGKSEIYSNTKGSESGGSSSAHEETGLERNDIAPKSEESVFDPSKTELEDRFGLNEHGHFGRKGKSRGVRVIDSSDPVTDAKAMYDELSKGGYEKLLPNGKGIKTEFDDGTTIIFREITSTAGSPAVEIRNSVSQLIRDQKIHFIMGEQL